MPEQTTDGVVESHDLFSKKPIPCEAIQYLASGPDVRGVCTGECRGPEYYRECAPHIHGLEGDHSVSEGDWIVKGIKGEFWAVKDEIFRATYEPFRARPNIVCLCGSTRFIETFAIKTWELEREGNIVLGCTLLPMWYCNVPSHFGEATGTKEQCDELHKRKIDLADEVLILDIGGYIGESTRSEIEYATALGKPIRYLSDEHRGAIGPTD